MHFRVSSASLIDDIQTRYDYISFEHFKTISQIDFSAEVPTVIIWLFFCCFRFSFLCSLDNMIDDFCHFAENFYGQFGWCEVINTIFFVIVCSDLPFCFYVIVSFPRSLILLVFMMMSFNFESTHSSSRSGSNHLQLCVRRSWTRALGCILVFFWSTSTITKIVHCNH